MRWMLNQLPNGTQDFNKVLFDLSMARDLIAASARYDMIFDEQIFKMT